jgi:flagellar hook-basal body complex protein FliE
MSPIGPIGSAVTPADLAPKPSASPSPGFGESLARLVQSVDSSASEANAAVDKMLNGEGDIHDAMIALQRAEMSLELTVQIRNKFVQAYQDIMRMPV